MAELLSKASLMQYPALCEPCPCTTLAFGETLQYTAVLCKLIFKDKSSFNCLCAKGACVHGVEMTGLCLSTAHSTTT